MSQISLCPKKLGQLLVERGQVSGEQVLRAIRSQRSSGGRLGTCLLEMEMVDEDRLLEILAEQQGAPPAHIEHLRAIPEAVVDLIPSRVAERCQAVPFQANDREIDVATLDVKNVARLDELAFCTSRRVRAHVANEVRIYEALAKYYGVECPRRYSQLVDRLNRARYLWKNRQEEDSEASDSLPDLRQLWEADGSGVTWMAPEEVFGTLAPKPAVKISAVKSPASPSSAVKSPAAQPPAERPSDSGNPPRLTLSYVDRLLQDTTTADEIGEVLMRYLEQHFERCALLRVRDGELFGWRARSSGSIPQAKEELRIGLREPSVFLNLMEGADFHLGALPPMPSHRRLVAALQGGWPSACLVVPVRLRERIVLFIYADQGSGKLGDLRLDDGKALAALASAAFELCILRTKLKTN